MYSDFSKTGVMQPPYEAVRHAHYMHDLRLHWAHMLAGRCFVSIVDVTFPVWPRALRLSHVCNLRVALVRRV